MNCHEHATHHVLPSDYKPSSPPTLIPCAPIESNTKPWPISMIWTFHLPDSVPAKSHMPTPLLLASLASTLNMFPVLCASLRQDSRGAATLCLDNSNPVTLIQAAHVSTLSSCIPPPSLRYGPPQPPKQWTHPQLVHRLLIPSDLCTAVSSDWTGTACSVQVTRWACGGVVLGLSAFHCLMDAQAAATFLGEWGRQCAALKAGLMETAIPPMAHLPTFDRAFMTDGLEAALHDNSIRDNIFRILPSLPPPAAPSAFTPPHVVSQVYHFPRAELELLRRAARGEAKDISAHDALFAHLVQVIAAATGTVEDEAVMVCQAMNGRRVFGQPHFFGSCAFWLHHRSTYAAILASLPATAAAIHHTHSSPDRGALLAYNAHLASAPTLAHVQLEARITTHDFHVASWRNCGMYDVDFGWGRPTLMGPAQHGYARYVIFVDGAKGTEGEGGVDVWLALEDAHWQRLVEQGNLHRYAADPRPRATVPGDEQPAALAAPVPPA